ncbi:MAG: c-type cytochrome [Methylophilales bacterium]|nr:c-type cytochrome [Methylophilales bacterium]
MSKYLLIVIFFTMSLGCYAAPPQDSPQIVRLGKKLFFDPRFSQPVGQSCASCHNPDSGFATPAGNMLNGIARGADGKSFTSRNAPSIAYNVLSPKPYFDKEPDTVVGGLFVDQREPDAEAQAGKPLLNPLEMANPDKAAVVKKLTAAGYEQELRSTFGEQATRDVESRFSAMTKAIAAYERSVEVNAFSSKYDAYLLKKAKLTPQELRGLKLFNSEKAGNCAACHPSALDHGKLPLFTDFTNDNLGVPRNTKNPFYAMPTPHNPAGSGYIDRGLADSELAQKILIKAQRTPEDYVGKFKVPTLRNVAVTAPYMHNGVFTNLKDVMRFYNTACTKGNPDRWPAAEVEKGRNCDEMGNLKLTESQMEDIIAFMKTLTDGYKPTLQTTSTQKRSSSTR